MLVMMIWLLARTLTPTRYSLRCIAQFKAQGNAALAAGRTTEAIEHYTKAIQLDGGNHVYG